ncbi:MAG: serine hydrolase domain-containing protein [Cyclobacteriaceae bacterium]
MTRLTLIILLFKAGSLLGQNYSDTLDAQFRQIFEESNLPGFSVGIFNEQSVLYGKGFGLANTEIELPYGLDNPQQIASISKTFIAVALMQCIEEGHFELETPINEILPFKVINPHHPEAEILVKHLANHTSSIVDAKSEWKNTYYLLNEVDFQSQSFTKEERKFLRGISANEEMTLEEYLKNYLIVKGEWYSKKIFSKSQAGINYSYSNLASGLAAYLVEAVQKMPYSSYIIEKIIQPLGMKNSGWEHKNSSNEDAIQHLSNGQPYPKFEDINYPSGNIKSTINDLILYQQDMMLGLKGEGQLLKTSSYESMFSPTSFNSDESESVGVFWIKHDVLGDLMHPGAAAGAVGVIGFNLEKNIGYVLLTNSGTHTDQQGESYVKIWRTILKYRELLTNARNE